MVEYIHMVAYSCLFLLRDQTSSVLFSLLHAPGHRWFIYIQPDIYTHIHVINRHLGGVYSFQKSFFKILFLGIFLLQRYEKVTNILNKGIMSRSCISGSILSPREVIQGSVGLPTSRIGHCAEIRVCSHPSLLCFSSVLPPFHQQEQKSRST